VYLTVLVQISLQGVDEYIRSISIIICVFSVCVVSLGICSFLR